MAVLSKHGEIGQVEYIDHKRAICADGNVMRNTGNGWKIWRKLKPGINPKESFDRLVEKRKQRMIDNPAYADFYNLICQWKLSDRIKICLAMDLLDGDIDGMYCELTDSYDRIELCIEDLIELCELQALAKQESQRNREVLAV